MITADAVTSKSELIAWQSWREKQNMYYMTISDFLKPWLDDSNTDTRSYKPEWKNEEKYVSYYQK